MDSIIEFFRGLFDYDRWPPRWHCGYWSDFHGWLYIVSELLIWFSYFLIPFIIITYSIRKKASIRYRSVYLLFAAFILLCGSTHFLDAMMFWIPMYRLNAIVRLLTGIVSVLTIFKLIGALPELFKQKTNIELEKEIERRKIAEVSLAKANESLNTFARLASHDLQEPLRKTSIFLSQLIEKNQVQFDEKSKELADKIQRSNKRMKALIADILTLSSVQGEIVLSMIDPSISLDTAIEDLEMRIQQSGATVQKEQLPYIWGEKTYVTQLFYNLINNAIKFCDKKPFVKVSGKVINDEVYIIIEDNGIGIEKEYFDKIFNPFLRLNDANSYEGSGIGLATCKKIVDALHGRIEINSIPSEGTTFTLIFKRAGEYNDNQ